MSYYDFKTEDAERFAREHGPVKAKGNELVFDRCPYCRGGQKPDKGTFSLNRITGLYQCKRASCGVSGNMVELARDFNFDLGEDVRRHYNLQGYNKRFKEFSEAHDKTYESKDAAVEYLKSRGI